jgi:hypothetical protein
MRSIFYFAPIVASHALAMESMNSGQLNALEKRQTIDYCGMDIKFIFTIFRRLRPDIHSACQIMKEYQRRSLLILPMFMETVFD